MRSEVSEVNCLVLGASCGALGLCCKSRECHRGQISLLVLCVKSAVMLALTLCCSPSHLVLPAGDSEKRGGPLLSRAHLHVLQETYGLFEMLGAAVNLPWTCIWRGPRYDKGHLYSETFGMLWSTWTLANTHFSSLM